MPVVLIVDDEDAFLHITEVILQRAGYRTMRASDGNEGLRLVEACPPDLLILDDMMPGMSGAELCLLLKRSPRFGDLPIIIHTAGARLRDRASSQATGADAVLIKPTPPDAMVELVGRLISARPS